MRNLWAAFVLAVLIIFASRTGSSGAGFPVSVPPPNACATATATGCQPVWSSAYATPIPTGTPIAMVYEAQAPAICNGTGLNGTCTATLVNGATAGHLLVFDMVGGIGSSTSPTGITGWTRCDYNSGTFPQSAIWYKTASGGDKSATVALTGGGYNTSGILVELANTSGTPTCADSNGGSTWSFTAKTLTGLTGAISAGGYALSGMSLHGLSNYYQPSATVNAPFQIASEQVLNQVGFPSEQAWLHGVYQTAGTAAPVLFAPSIINLVWGTYSSVASTLVTVSPGATLVAQSPLPTPTNHAAFQSDSYVAAAGINIHMPYAGTVYDTYRTNPAPNGNTVISALETLGVRHVRDDSEGESNGFWCGVYAPLNSAGIDVDISPLGSVASPSTMTDTYIANDVSCVGSGLSGYEGINEYNAPGNGVYNNGATWAQGVFNVQQVISLAQPTYLPAGVAVVAGPLITASETDLNTLAALTSGNLGSGTFAGYNQKGNIHAYIGSNLNPDTLGTGPTDSYGISGSYAATVAWQGITSPGKPVWATEYGYPVGPAAGSAYVDHPTQAKYYTRGMLQLYYLGVQRSYTYQLALENTTDTWAVMDSYLNPTQTYTALANMNAILKDPGASFATRALPYSISSTPDVRSMLYQKRDGSYWLVLWQNDNDWDYSNGEVAITVPSTTATIVFPSVPSYLKYYTISSATGAVTTSTPTPALAVSLTVTDMPQILQIGTATTTPSPVPTQTPNCGGATPCPSF